MIFYEYPPCSTCTKARKHLEAEGVTFQSIHIKETPPTKEQLEHYLTLSGLDVQHFFNTSGLSYRALNLKERMNDLTLDEKLTLLASDGMLIKRPLLIYHKTVLVGYKEHAYTTLLKEIKQ